ncbi:MAG: hypothetical protein H5T86_09030, partial [Armatimonadetes bacterium]|nr:hypothetical protein [Armatimonadota bacterium]
LKITLANPFVADNTVFHVYVDWDNDKSTGRQDNDWVRGCDLMYSTVNGSFSPRIFTHELRVDPEIPARQQIVDNEIYICDDVKPKRVGQEAEFRIYILSHMADNPGDADSTEWAIARVPVDAARRAPELPYPRRAGFELLPADWELVAAIWHNEQTLWLKPSEAEIQGLRLQHDESVDAGPGSEGERRVTFSVPKAGRYYICCELYARGCQFPGVHVLANGRTVGTIAAGASMPDDMLAFSSEPVSFRKGDRLTFQVAENSGPVWIGRFMLSAVVPQMPPLRVENIQAWHMPDEPGKPAGRVLVTWRTNRIAQCSVRYSVAGPEAYRDEGQIEPQPAGAHRCFFVVLPRERFRASRYELQIEASEQPADPYWKGSTARARTIVEMRPPAPGREMAGEVQLTVELTDNQKMPWPVRSGVPLPRGRLWDPSHCQLLGPDGRPLDAQFVAWSRWPDHSIKWLIVDFVDDFPRLADKSTDVQKQTYTLRYGVLPHQPAGSVSITTTNGSLSAQGRRVKLLFPTDALFGEIWCDRDGDGNMSDYEKLPAPRLELVDAGGKQFIAGPPDETTVMESGPIHAIVRRAGWFTAADGTKYFRYLVLLHIWRDLPRVYLEISLDNANVQEEMSRLTRLSLVLPAGGDSLLLADLPPRRLSSQPLRLLQHYDNRFLIDGQQAGKRFGGWACVMNGRSPVLLAAVRDFWKLWPKGFRAATGELTIDLLPQLPEDAYQSKEDRELVDRLYFWCDNGKYKLRAGVRVTTDVLLDLTPPAQTAAMAAAASRVDRPPFAAASPEYYSSSGAFGKLYPRDGKTFPRYDENMDWSFADFLQRRETIREYGFMNYGDWWGERQWNWGNEEYDTPWALALLWAHNGNREMLYNAIAAARHSSDVDTVHYSSNPANVGKLYCHCLGHTGGYFPPTWKDMGVFAQGNCNYGHTWCTGQLTVAALTGDYRVWESGLSIADEVTRNATPRASFYARDAGWTTIAMMSGYEATSNPWYLNGARLMVDRMLQRQDPDTGRMGAHFLDGSECPHRPQHYGAKPFMTGVMLRGLRMYHQAEPRPDVARAIVRCADWYWDHAWVEKDLGFWYSECPKFMSTGGPWTFSLCGDGLAYAAVLDRDYLARRKDLLKLACSAFLYRAGRGGFGKSFTQLSCSTLHALELLRQVGVTDVEPPPEKKAVAPVITARSALALLPGEGRDVFPFVFNPSGQTCSLTIETKRTPPWLSVHAEAPDKVAPGQQLFPTLHFRCAHDAPAGATGEVELKFRVGALSKTVRIRIAVAGSEQLGGDSAVVTGDRDYLGAALAQAGLKLPPLSDASWDMLRRLRVLVVGTEA